MEPSFRILPAKKLVGKRLAMSLANNRTFELWSSFMSRRKEIGNSVGTDRFSMQLYPAGYFEQFSLQTEFVKWAAVEVPDFDAVPESMETYLLPGGLYAVFPHKGMDTGIFQYIYGTWVPNSEYALDERPSFELLGEKYRNGDPDSEEEIWVPIKPKDNSNI